MKLRSMFCLLIHLFSFILKCLSECHFPDYMQSEGDAPSWFIEYEHGKNVEITVRQNRMFLRECRTVGYKECKEFDRLCMRYLGEGKFLVKQVLRPRSYDYTFKCMQLLRRSKSVVQIKISPIEDKIKESLCLDEMLFLDQYPMISRRHSMEVNKCPITGGYDVQLYTAENSAPICDEIFLPLRVESDCLAKEGMKFYFRRRHCVNRFIDKELHEDPIELRCLATWSDTFYVFSVVKWNKDPKFWCTRVEYRDGEVYEMIIFFSGICPSETRSYNDVLIFRHFKRHYVNSICADQTPICRYESNESCSNNSDKCKLTCQICSPEIDEQPCVFPRVYKGLWNSLHEPASTFIQIGNTSLLESKSDLKWQCVASSGVKSHRRQVLKLTFSNACFPRYMCIELELTTLSVLRLRTGIQLTWPIDSLKHTCDDSYFDFKPTGGMPSRIVQKDRPWNYFVNERPKYVSCNLPWFISKVSSFYMYNNNNSQVNKGCLINNAGSPSHVLKLMYTYNNNENGYVNTKVHKVHTFVCLASLKGREENNLLITQDVDAGQYMCWTFIRGPAYVFIYIFHSNDCGNGTNMQLLTSYPVLAKLVIKPNASDCNFIHAKEQRPSILRRSEDTVSSSPNNRALKQKTFSIPVIIFLLLCLISRS